MSWLSSVGQWLGKNALGVANLAVNGLSSWLGMRQQNANIDKQLAAQQVEQEKIRDYNYEMWRENNAYNSPMQQKARLEQAGLNADLMYGQGGVMNTASSPSPATPMDWSSLSNKRTVGDAVMQGLAIEQARANIRKTNAEADIRSADADVRARMNSLGLSKLEIDTDLAKELSELYNSQRNSLDLSVDEAMWRKGLRDKFGNEYVENKIKQMAAEVKISESQMEYEVETLAQRIVGTNAENTPLVNISNLSNQNVRLLIDVLKVLFK